jgi:hypothetical protein
MKYLGISGVGAAAIAMAVASAAHGHTIHKSPFRLKSPPAILQRRAVTATRSIVGGGRPYKHEYLQFHNRIYAIFVWRRPAVCGGCSTPPGVRLPRRHVFVFVFSLSTLEDTGGVGWCGMLRECKAKVARAGWP